MVSSICMGVDLMVSAWAEAAQKAREQREMDRSIFVDGKISWPRVRSRMRNREDITEEEGTAIVQAFEETARGINQFLESDEGKAGIELLRETGEIVEICVGFSAGWRILSRTGLSADGFFQSGKGYITTDELVRIVLHEFGGSFADVDVDNIVDVIKGEFDRIAKQVDDPNLRLGRRRVGQSIHRPLKPGVITFCDLSQQG